MSCAGKSTFITNLLKDHPNPEAIEVVMAKKLSDGAKSSNANLKLVHYDLLQTVKRNGYKSAGRGETGRDLQVIPVQSHVNFQRICRSLKLTKATLLYCSTPVLHKRMKRRAFSDERLSPSLRPYRRDLNLRKLSKVDQATLLIKFGRLLREKGVEVDVVFTHCRKPKPVSFKTLETLASVRAV